jgi:hypothetical protein
MRQRYRFRAVEATEYELFHVASRVGKAYAQHGLGQEVRVDAQLVARYQRAQRELRAAGRAVYEATREQIEDR